MTISLSTKKTCPSHPDIRRFPDSKGEKVVRVKTTPTRSGGAIKARL